MRTSGLTVIFTALCVCIVMSTLIVNADTIAFPGAEGYGRFAQGGRGGDVYIVTNLSDAGAGSLRYGIENMNGPRTIVFAVSGTIELKDDLKIKDSFLTIAGQTAPGDGICLKDYGLELKNVNNIIMRYIRVRMGDQNKGTSSGADCITSSKISDVIFDHISAGWGIDAIHDNREGGNFTLQWSIYGETLHDSIHYEGFPHSKLGSFRETTKNISIHHNLLHSTHGRHPSMGGGELTTTDVIIDFRNNLIYNADAQTNLGSVQLNVINNYYKNGPDTDTGDLPMRIKAKAGKGPAPTGFTSGNIFTWNQGWTDDNYSAIKYIQSGTKYLSTSQAEWKLPAELVFGADKPLTQSASDAYDLILLHAGASISRDSCDDRIIDEVINSTGNVPDSQDDVGGWPTLNSLPAPTDSDQDGMSDVWELAQVPPLDPADPSDRNNYDFSSDYTNLEVYINSIIGESDPPLPNPATFASMPLFSEWNWVSFNLTPEDASIGAVLQGYALSDNDVIKTTTGSATYFGGQWFPSSRDFELETGLMYKILKQSAGDESFEVTGQSADPSASIELVSGSNWIGYNLQDPAEVDVLVHSGGFLDNDVIKGQEGSATYFGGQWFPSSESFRLKPGIGYLLNTANPGQLTFDNVVLGSQEIVVH